MNTQKIAYSGGVAAALGVLSEMAYGAVVWKSVNTITESGYGPSLEFNPVTGDATALPNQFYMGTCPSLDEPAGLHYECYEAYLCTPGHGDITDIDGQVTSGTTLDLLDVGDVVSTSSTFNVTSETSKAWAPPINQDIYVGYRFMQTGETQYNYGYCKYSITGLSYNAAVHLKSVAYESQAGQPVTVQPVPEPGIIGAMLVCGIVACLFRRLFS